MVSPDHESALLVDEFEAEIGIRTVANDVPKTEDALYAASSNIIEDA